MPARPAPRSPAASHTRRRSWERQRETSPLCAPGRAGTAQRLLGRPSFPGRQPRGRAGGTSPSHLPRPHAATSCRTVGSSICPHEQRIKVPGPCETSAGGATATAAALSGGAMAGIGAIPPARASLALVVKRRPPAISPMSLPAVKGPKPRSISRVSIARVPRRRMCVANRSGLTPRESRPSARSGSVSVRSIWPPGRAAVVTGDHRLMAFRRRSELGRSSTLGTAWITARSRWTSA
jgi:hypothetical protein